MGYNLTNARFGEKHVENIKMAKFEAPINKELEFITVRIFQRVRRLYGKSC